MIDSDVSGVLFTRDPMNEKDDRFVISSVYGVGEGLVSGDLDGDTYWLEQTTGNVLAQEIVAKEYRYGRSNRGPKKFDVEKELHSKPSLDSAMPWRCTIPENLRKG